MKRNKTGIDEFENSVLFVELNNSMIQLIALYEDSMELTKYCLRQGYNIPESARKMYEFVEKK